MPQILPSDLKAGDVLLYRGTSFLSDLIRLFDGGDYSHASIYDGQNIMEALGQGITVDPVSQSVVGAKYVDVYRFIGDGGNHLGDDAYPPAPLLGRIQYYEQNRQRYAYEQILLLAILASTRRIPVISWIPGLSIIVRNILDNAADVLARIMAAGQEPVICSELVYRCYSEADAGGKYRLAIRGADVMGSRATFAALSELTGGSEAAVDPLLADKQAFLARLAQAKGMPAALSPTAAAGFAAVADFVTPHDLQASPNLVRVGTLPTGDGVASTAVFMGVERAVAGELGIANTPIRIPPVRVPPGPIPSPGRPLTVPANERLPEFHAGMVLVRARRDAQSRTMFSNVVAPAAVRLRDQVVPAAQRAMLMNLPFESRVASGVDPELRDVSPGLAVLALFERAGKVRRATRLARPLLIDVAARPAGALASIAASVEQDVELSMLAGTTLVELHDDADVPRLLQALSNDPHVERAERVPIRYLVAKGGRGFGVPGAAVPMAVPPSAPLWNLLRIQWPQAQQVFNFQSSEAIKVAVLDTGVDINHPDLAGRITNYVWDNPDDPAVSGDRDIIGHGTHVAGTIGAKFGSPIGISGIAPCELHCWKIFTDTPIFISWTQGFGYVVDPGMYLRALTDCYEKKIDVINLSIGGTALPSSQETELFAALQSQGTTICAAMGNGRLQGSPKEYPRAIDGVVAVGATSIDDTFAYFSTAGDHIALCAPGMGIWSTLPTYTGQFGFAAINGPAGNPRQGAPKVRETDYDAWQGTSMATPHVTAAAALWLAKFPGSPPDKVKDALMASADKVPDMKGLAFMPDYGAGRLNLLILLR
jgi:hypothetical protein